MQYLVLELQTGTDGSVAHIINKYSTLAEAEQNYFDTMSFVCVSSLPCHGVMLLTNEGEVLKAGFYHREVTDDNETV